MISETVVLFHYYMLLYALLCYSIIIYCSLYLIININSNKGFHCTGILTIALKDIMGNLLCKDLPGVIQEYTVIALEK